MDRAEAGRALRGQSGSWRTAGDTVERLEELALRLVSGERQPAPKWHRTRAVLGWIERRLRPGGGCLRTGRNRRGPRRARRQARRARSERRAEPGAARRAADRAQFLFGRYPRGADPRRLAARLAFGRAARRALCAGARHLAGAARAVGLGHREHAHRRRRHRAGAGADRRAAGLGGRQRPGTGFEILPASVLDRPRVDVTLRISGFFRDAFPGLIDLFDSAVRAVAALDEPPATNPLAARVAADRAALEAAGASPDEAARRAGYRVFGSKPGAYGAGLQAMIDERIWRDDADLADAYLAWSGWAYGAGGEGRAERGLFEARLAATDAVLHNQDNREHDLLDSDDYYQFEGGLAVAIRHLSGRAVAVYHNDHSPPTGRASAPCARRSAASCAAAPPTRAGSPA